MPPEELSHILLYCLDYLEVYPGKLHFRLTCQINLRRQINGLLRHYPAQPSDMSSLDRKEETFKHHL